MDPRIKAALGVMEENFHELLTLDRMAARVGLSRSRFEYLFGQETGLPFKSYLLSLRLTHAKKLLADRDLNIKQIAFAVGYHHTPNFTRDFKKHFAKTPSQYRGELTATPSTAK